MSGAALRSGMPWWARLGLKFVLARLPLNYRTWRRLRVFRHGTMNQPAYAWQVFREHYARSDFPAKGGGFDCLEIGPGDSLFSCLIARSHGAKRCYLLDSGAYALRDLAAYREMADFLARQGLKLPGGVLEDGLEGMLRACGGIYFTQGLTSLRAIPDTSIDWIWSHAVLEHIRRIEFGAYLAEMRRVLKPGGICSHRVDLRDHLGGALNNLRFPGWLWEADWMARSGFYTNRIRYQEMRDEFDRAGFEVELIALDCWDRMPTPIASLDSEFRVLPEEDLLVRGFDLVMKVRA